MFINKGDRHEYHDFQSGNGSQHLRLAHHHHSNFFYRTFIPKRVIASTSLVMKIVCLCLLVSSFVQNSTASQVGSEKKEEKLISILENLQLSIQEILHTIGTPSSSTSRVVGGRAGVSSSSILSKSSSGSRPPYSQRPEAGGKDYPTSSSSSGQRDGKSLEDGSISPSVGGPVGGNGLSSDRDSPPRSGSGASSPGDTFTPPKKFGPGLPFRVS
jgi:hypothetical protein